QSLDDRVVLVDHTRLGRTCGCPQVIAELDVGLVVLGPLLRGVVLVVDRLDRAGRLPGTAVHALVRLDVQYPAGRVDAGHGALVHTGPALHVHAGQGDDVRHVQLPSAGDRRHPLSHPHRRGGDRRVPRHRDVSGGTAYGGHAMAFQTVA